MSGTEKALLAATTSEEAKVAGVAMLLESLGFTAASRDVTLANVARYAKWILRELEGRSVRVDFETRARSVDPISLKVFEDARDTFARMGL